MHRGDGRSRHDRRSQRVHVQQLSFAHRASTQRFAMGSSARAYYTYNRNQGEGAIGRTSRPCRASIGHELLRTAAIGAHDADDAIEEDVPDCAECTAELAVAGHLALTDVTLQGRGNWEGAGGTARNAAT